MDVCVCALVEVVNWCLVFVPVGAGSMSSLKVSRK